MNVNYLSLHLIIYNFVLASGRKYQPFMVKEAIYIIE